MRPIIAKASTPYLVIACVFFAAAVLLLVPVVLLDQSGEPLLDRLAICGLAALPGVFFVLIYRNKRIELDDRGITVQNLFGQERRYSLDEITDAEVKGHYAAGSAYRECTIRANGRKIAEIPIAFDGYLNMAGYLRHLGILQEDGE